MLTQVNLEALAQAWVALRRSIDALPAEERELVRCRAADLGATTLPGAGDPLSAEYARRAQCTFGVTTFGEFALYPLNAPRETVKIRSRKARELFCYLLAEGARGVSKERIAQELWCDSSSRNVPAVIDVCLAHLRRDLRTCGLPEIIFSRNRRYFLDSTCLQCDFETFRMACETFRRNPNLGTALHIAELHRGDYMGAFEAAWATSDRVRYRLLWSEAMEYIQSRPASGAHADIFL